MMIVNRSPEHNILNAMKRMMKITAIIMVLLLAAVPAGLYAHCDSYDGPVIKDALKALENNDVSLVLKWVSPSDEQQITDLFNKTYALKNGDQQIYEIVREHFLETLVRLHRAHEGAPYTGLKPAGSASPIVKMADIALDEQNIDDLLTKLDNHINRIVREKYERVVALNNSKDHSVELGREYVEAYVDYTHTLEAIHGVLESGPGHHAQ